MQTMQMSFLRLFFAATLMPGVAAAQTAIGSGCVTLNAGVGDHSITLIQPAAANSWIVISAAADNAQAHFAATPVSDTAGNGYPIYDATLMAGGSGVLATFAGRTASALSAGSQITVHYTDNGLFAMQSCVEAAALPGVVPVPDPSDGYGENKGSGSTLSVTIGLPSQYASEIIYSAFASAATPGAMSALAPAQGLGQVCSGDAALCLLPAWNLGAPVTGISEGADASSANSAAFGALIITFQNNDRIFANGFD